MFNETQTKGLDCLVSLFLEMDQITDDAVKSYENKDLNAPSKGERVIGTITDANTKRLFIAGKSFLGRSMEFSGKALADLEREAEYKSESARYKEMASTARQIFWHEAKCLTGNWEDSIGVRKGWDIVAMQDKNDGEMPDFLRKLLGGE